VEAARAEPDVKDSRYCHALGFGRLADKSRRISMHRKMKENPALRYSDFYVGFV